MVALDPADAVEVTPVVVPGAFVQPSVGTVVRF
jgi:hypothetical protein